jgi:hypothetical protein
VFLSCDISNVGTSANKVDMVDINQIYNEIRKGPVKGSLADIDRDILVTIFDHNLCVTNFDPLGGGDRLP